MSTLKAKAIDPVGASLSLGASGDSVIMSSVSTDTLQDTGGNAISVEGGMVLISSATASGSSSIEFTSGIDDSFDEYVFYFVDIAASTDAVHLRMQADIGGGYGVSLTSTFFVAYHSESDTYTSLTYDTGWDLAQSTSDQPLIIKLGTQSDEGGAGEMRLFSPSSDSKVKHWYSRCQSNGSNDYSYDSYGSGYFNTISALSGVRFAPSSGTFSGQIHLFGVK